MTDVPPSRPITVGDPTETSKAPPRAEATPRRPERSPHSTRASAAAGDPPVTTRDAWTWLALAGLGFVGGQVASGILLFICAVATGQTSRLAQLTTQRVPPSWVVISGLVGLWIGFLGATVSASRVRGTGNIRRDFGLEFRARDIILGPVIGLAGQLLLLRILYLPLEHLVPRLNDKLSQPAKHITAGFPGADLAVIAVLTVVVVPVVEELFFRGLVLRALVRLFARAGPVIGPVVAVATSGILFGLAHFELLQLLGLAAFGVVLSAMAYLFRRLGPSIFAHATFNLLAILSVAFPTGLLR